MLQVGLVQSCTIACNEPLASVGCFGGYIPHNNEVQMNKTIAVVLMALLCAFTLRAEEFLSPHLKPLAPLIGKTWRGTFKDSTPEKPMHDVARWERALNGQAIRILHSVNDGIYGGETIVVWDSTKQSLIFSYFTTAGFYTSGTIQVDNGRIVTHEMVTGNSQGITEVKGTSVLLPDGAMRTTAMFLKDGEWIEGHEILYREDPSATVVFK
jgi:hypothetical protein